MGVWVPKKNLSHARLTSFSHSLAPSNPPDLGEKDRAKPVHGNGS